VSLRGPYLVSTLGHLVALTLLVALTALGPRALQVTDVHIVSLPAGGGGSARAEAEPRQKPAETVQPAPPKPVPAPPKPAPKEKKAPEKAVPRREPRVAERDGALRSSDPGMVSKSKAKATATPVVPAAAGRAGVGGGPGAGNGRGGVGVEGESGRDSWYFGLLRDRIAEVWRPPAAIGRTGEAQVAVHFLLRPAGGQPDRVEVQQGSQASLFDRAAMRAVLEAAPYPPLPADLATEPIGIRLTFTQQY